MTLLAKQINVAYFMFELVIHSIAPEWIIVREMDDIVRTWDKPVTDNTVEVW